MMKMFRTGASYVADIPGASAAVAGRNRLQCADGSEPQTNIMTSALGNGMTIIFNVGDDFHCGFDGPFVSVSVSVSVFDSNFPKSLGPFIAKC